MSSKSRKLIISTIPLLIILLINLSSYATAQPSICTSNGGYTKNTTFDTNLFAILSTLPLNVPDNGYYAASIRGLNVPETISAFALCRGDLTPAQCRTCVHSAAPDVYRICRNQRRGVIWPDQSCEVRYTDTATLTPSPPTLRYTLSSGVNATSTAKFKAERDALLSDLRALAAGGGSELKVGAGSRSTSSVGSESSAIYGLVQCRPDLSSGDCRTCLEESTAAMQDCCDFQTGVRVLKPDCIIHYEIRSFYNASRLSERGGLLP